MTKGHGAAALGAVVLATLAVAGCKQPVRTAAAPAAPASSTATSGAVPAPMSDAAVSGADATGKADFRAAKRQVRDACREDLQACRSAGGDTKPMRCLRTRINQLKPECKQALQTMLAERREGRGGRGAR